MNNDCTIEGSSCLNHLPCDCPHTSQAHLRQVVKVIFVNCYDSGTMFLKRLGKSRLGILQHGVKYRDRIALISEHGRRIQSTEWRIWLHLTNLFAVVREMVRVCQ